MIRSDQRFAVAAEHQAEWADLVERTFAIDVLRRASDHIFQLAIIHANDAAIGAIGQEHVPRHRLHRHAAGISVLDDDARMPL